MYNRSCCVRFSAVPCFFVRSICVRFSAAISQVRGNSCGAIRSIFSKSGSQSSRYIVLRKVCVCVGGEGADREVGSLPSAVSCFNLPLLLECGTSDTGIPLTADGLDIRNGDLSDRDICMRFPQPVQAMFFFLG